MKFENIDAIRRAEAAARHEIWIKALTDDSDTDSPQTKAYFLNSSSVLFKCGKTRWLLDPVYEVVYNLGGAKTDELREIAALIREKVGGIVISHQHADHYSIPLRELLEGSGVNYFGLLPGVSPAEICHTRFSIGDFSFEIFPGYHAEIGMPQVDSVAFEVTFPCGIRLALPGDTRNYSVARPQTPVDYQICHVFLGRSAALQESFPWTEDFARFVTSRPAKTTFLSHLYEISRAAEDLWTRRHAEAAKEAIAKFAPAMEVIIPTHGEMIKFSK